ncbi:uncharacterized protein LOC130277525 [Hyla sarda]|uniref:uncharacterized protein LOC130277525 n=1 Tax=Hyla sarda TaxID=327740 RepID=UPI0024C2864A|nr:uncharacterized protein LOC130277525 [Hyla sarda]
MSLRMRPIPIPLPVSCPQQQAPLQIDRFVKLTCNFQGIFSTPMMLQEDICLKTRVTVSSLLMLSASQITPNTYRTCERQIHRNFGFIGLTLPWKQENHISNKKWNNKNINIKFWRKGDITCSDKYIQNGTYSMCCSSLRHLVVTDCCLYLQKPCDNLILRCIHTTLFQENCICMWRKYDPLSLVIVRFSSSETIILCRNDDIFACSQCSLPRVSKFKISFRRRHSDALFFRHFKVKN